MMSKREFAEKLTGMLEDMMGQGYVVKERGMKKVNLGEVSTLTIFKKGASNKITPTFYVEQMYELYLAGKEIKEMAEWIVEKYFEQAEENGVIQKLEKLSNLKWECVSDRIVFQIVSKENNEEILKDLPHIPFLDLAIIFSILLENSENETKSIKITKSLAENWGIDTNQLYERAVINTPELLPWQMQKMSQYLSQVMPGFALEEDDKEFYILSNIYGLNGFATVAYPNLLEKIAEEFQEDFYILPSSIHEALLLPVSCGISVEYIQSMVRDVNQNIVEKEDKLTDEVYQYDSSRKEMVMVGKGCEIYA